MTKNLKATLTVVLVAAGVLAFLLLAGRPAGPEPVAQQSGAPADLLVRENSHRLTTAPDGRVTFVEFLDFECEACRATYPAIEQLRAEYGDRVTFVVRYFPLPGHANAQNAAVAVEAAARQGHFEAMYQRMFETQTEWGEQRVSHAATFRGFATALGLDMAAYDRAVADPATAERVRVDQRDGEAAGVQGTPTFFLDGRRLEPRSLDDLRTALDRALGQ